MAPSGQPVLHARGLGSKGSMSSLRSMRTSHLQAASLRFGTTLTLHRPVPRPSSAAGVACIIRRGTKVAEAEAVSDTPSGIAGNVSEPLAGARRPQTAVPTKSSRLSSEGFAAAMSALRTGAGSEIRDSRQSPGGRSIGSLVGRGRGVAHCAAAAQAHNESMPRGTPLPRSSSAGALGRCDKVQAGAGGGAVASRAPVAAGEAGIFEEIIRTDQFFGPILQEIKASYKAILLDKKPALDGKASAAEIAVDAVRRPWTGGTEIGDGGEETERAGSRGRQPADKVQRLEEENAALRELVRRFHIKLKQDNPTKVQPGRDPCAGRLHQKAVSLPSVWSSPEPLAAAMLRPPRRRPTLVPALNLSDIWDSSEYEEEEEEEADDNDDSEVFDGPDGAMAVLVA